MSQPLRVPEAFGVVSNLARIKQSTIGAAMDTINASPSRRIIADAPPSATLKMQSALIRVITAPLPRSNGEVEGPRDRVSKAPRARNLDWVPRRPSAADQAPRAHNFSPRPRRQAAVASRPPPTIVRPHVAALR